MNVLSLFDGISCGRIALERAGIKVDKYYASEIKEEAIKVSLDNWKDIIQVGDITKLKGDNFKDIDLIIGGSPCQSFSNAGNKEGFDGKSGLFYEYLRLLKEIKPKYFLLENVRMKQEWQDKITEMLKEIYPETKVYNINSKLVSAQLRNRFYWTNIPNIEQPEDKGIILKDILENGYTDREKSRAILESEKILTTIVYNKPLKVRVRKYKVDIDKLKIELRSHKLPHTLQEIADILKVNKTKVEHWFRDDNSFAIPDENIWFKLKELLNITTDEFDKSIIEFEIKDSTYDMSNRVYDTNGKICCLTKTGCSTQRIYDNNDIRYFTQTELERLQTLPDGYTKCLTRNKAAGCIGDGWTVDVITHILKNII